MLLFERGCGFDSDSATYHEAIRAYEQCIELDPSFADAHCNLGAVLYNAGKPEPARRCFERCLEIDRTHVEVNEWLETGEKGVYAIGDLVGPPWLAHKASHEGVICVEKIKGQFGLVCTQTLTKT